MSLKKRLNSVLTDEELNQLIVSYDVIGDIAITIIPPELSHRETLIGTAILKANKNIRSVVRRAGYYRGGFRTIKLKIIAGEDLRETIHKEFGLRLCLSPADVYFSVRSSTERKRIASLVNPGETVLVMFSGIAPYPLHIAKFSNAATIVGIEKNPVAHRYAEKNLALNKLQDRIRLYHGDVKVICPQLEVFFDRIVMPLPKTGGQYFSLALSCLKDSGVIHYYTIGSPDTIEDTVATMGKKCFENGRGLINYRAFRCGHTGPNCYRYCIDASIK